MMEKLTEHPKYWKTSTRVELGDRVKIHRKFLRDINGTVVQVYDPNRPFHPKSDNEFGFSVKAENGQLFQFAGMLVQRVTFISRKSS